MGEERPGPGLAGLAGIVCLAVALGAFLVMAPLPTAVWVGLLAVGGALVAFAAFRSLRSPA